MARCNAHIAHKVLFSSMLMDLKIARSVCVCWWKDLV